MRVGSIQIVPISDGSTAVPASMLFSATEEQWAPHRRFLDAKGRVPMEIGGFLIRGAGDRVALVDLGIGSLGHAIGMGTFMESLRDAGVEPPQVTDVLFTHLHLDHIGWAVTEETPTFPNATYRCAQDDWAFFVDPGGASPSPLAALINAPSEAEHLGPVAADSRSGTRAAFFPE